MQGEVGRRRSGGTKQGEVGRRRRGGAIFVFFDVFKSSLLTPTPDIHQYILSIVWSNI